MITLRLFFLLIFLLKISVSIRIGQIKHSSIITNTSFISTSSSTCLDCLCDCLEKNNSIQRKCYGINCFPSKHLCQQIQQSWIQENDILLNSTSNQFINTIDLNFCSCYSVQNLLNKYANVTPTAISHSSVRYITYNPSDDTLIVLGNNLIAQYYVSNLTRFRNISTSIIPYAVYTDSINIYITFGTNSTVNKYDMNLKFIKAIKPTGSMVTAFYGLAQWKNQLFISDYEQNLIWSINMTTMNISIYRNMSSYDFSPFTIVVFEDQLYISEYSSSIIYILNLISLSIQNIIFPNSIQTYRLQIDPYCNRVWFGTVISPYTTVPVLNLDTNIPNIYQSSGALAQSTTYKVTFDSNYSMYTVAISGNYFYKYQMSTISCAE